MTTLRRQSFTAILTKHEASLPPQIVLMLRDLLQMMTDLEESLENLLGNGLTFADNHDFQRIDYTTNATPDTEDAVAHVLKRIPSGFLVVNKDKAGDLYASGFTWTKTHLYLKSDVASVAVSIYVF